MSPLDQIGQQVDARLAELDLHLTQGGEPTFVPFQPKAPEWNTEALGPEKMVYARRLAGRLMRDLFRGAVAVRSQGKRYPGEPLPRWSLNIYRLAGDNAPNLWNDPARLLPEPGKDPVDPELALKFLRTLAAGLGLKDTVVPAYEDIQTWLAREHPEQAEQLRTSVDRGESAVSLAARVDLGGLSGWDSVAAPKGWILPLDFSEDKWITDEWSIPGASEITLIPGESAIGLRLPLGRLAKDSLRRALTAEIKDNELTLFLPPLPDTERFRELVARIEAVAGELDAPPLTLEGYPPAHDPNLENISLTSDPGVIEVNLPPARDFAELAHVMRTLYADADAVGLCGHKLQFNGREVGSGGGSHVMLGGPSLDDNPFVKNPRVLGNLLRFLVNHPGLSYAFSGQYLGPSCQAPRPDESVYGLLEELEIAIQTLESFALSADPAFIDRLLRNLLLDWNGNTHRAEICVDKFCNPHSANGRLGVIEFRAMEMMPDADSTLAVHLLLRALTAAIASDAVEPPLIRWRQSLHDQFLLPAWIERDLAEVLRFIGSRGIEFPATLFEPHLLFRMPVIHRWTGEGVELEVRQALDIWPAMGDGDGGTARKVDASTDRLQITLRGDDRMKYLVIVAGAEIRLHDLDGTRLVGGVRFRAFENSDGLHPHIKPHVPLTIDVVLCETHVCRHSVRYSTWRFDGALYEGLPKNREEARRRVEQRVEVLPDRVGGVPPFVHAPEESRELWTTDLRRVDARSCAG